VLSLLKYGMKVVSLSELRASTGSFSNEQRLGRGAFGDVYAGTLGGCGVAVKRLRLDGSQVRGDNAVQPHHSPYT